FKFTLRVVKVLLVFPQLCQQSGLYARLQASGFEIHFSNLEKQSYKVAGPINQPMRYNQSVLLDSPHLPGQI
ncbi:unnamed protein product, partial [Musa acuminata subsp. burmannicoides]